MCCPPRNRTLEVRRGDECLRHLKARAPYGFLHVLEVPNSKATHVVAGCKMAILVEHEMFENTAKNLNGRSPKGTALEALGLFCLGLRSSGLAKAEAPNQLFALALVPCIAHRLLLSPRHGGGTADTLGCIQSPLDTVPKPQSGPGHKPRSVSTE